MRFFIAGLLAVLPFLAAAQQTEQENNDDLDALKSAEEPSVLYYGNLGLLATRPGSPIHLQPINANGQFFWIGKPTASYCPLTPQSSCPKGKKTIVYIYVISYPNGNSETSVSLDGAPSVYQGVYVREKGALIYGLADTPYVYPVAGEETPNWSYTPGTEYGNLYAQPLNSDVTKGFLACPSGKNFTGPWQVFADLEGLKDSDVTGGKLCECLPIDIITSNTTDGDGVYQYV